MKKSVAISLMNCLNGIGELLNRATQVIDEIESSAEQEEVRQEFGAIIIASIEASRPIIRQYPELDPDQDAEFA